MSPNYSSFVPIDYTIVQQFYFAARYSRLPSMPKQEIGEQHLHPAETQQQQQTQRQTTTAGTPHPSAGHRQETTGFHLI